MSKDGSSLNPSGCDGTARVYVMNSSAELFEADPGNWTLSDVLVTGPDVPTSLHPAWSGLADPLTECITNFPEPE